MSSSTRLIKPAQEIEFNAEAFIHPGLIRDYPRVLRTTYGSSAHGGRADRIPCEAMTQWLGVVRQRTAIRETVVCFESEGRDGSWPNVLGCATGFFGS